MREDYTRFARLLKKRGMTAADLSRSTGIAPSAFTKWKQGISKPKVDKMIKIAAVLDCPLETLL